MNTFTTSTSKRYLRLADGVYQAGITNNTVMETRTDKSDIIANTNGYSKAQIYMNGGQLEKVNNFKYLNAVLA